MAGNEVRITVTSRDRSGPGMDSARRRSDQLGKSVQRTGEIAQGIIAAQFFERIGQAAERFLGSAASSASRLEQAVGGTKAVFGDARGEVDEFGKTAAATAGLSEAEFRDMSTLIGGQFKRMTGDVGFASDAAIRLTKVGADLAATYGGTTKEAMDAFAAALRGEADPAERFNLNLKASVVGTKAVEMGLATSTTEVDDAARAQAILALIMEQSADAQGQFGREADTAAVAQQKLNAEYENAQAALGQALLPAVSLLSNALTSVLQAFQALPGPAQAVIGTLVLLGAGVLMVTSRVAPMVIAMQAAGISMGTMATKARGAAAVLAGPWGIALGAAVTVLGVFAVGQQRAKARVEELAATLDVQTGALTDNTRALVVAQLEADGWLKRAREIGVSTKTMTDAAMGDAAALEIVRARLSQVTDVAGGEALTAYQELDEELLVYGKNVEEAQEATRRKAEAMGQDAAATGEAAIAQQQATAAAAESAKAVEVMKKAWQDAADSFVDSTKAFNDASEDLREDQKLTADMVLEQLRRQVEAQDNWHANMIELAQRIPPALHDELARLGPDGAEQVALLNSMTDAQLAQWVEGMGRRGHDAAGNLISEVQANFVAGAPAIRAIAEQEGAQVAAQIAAGMKRNGTTVEQEARRIGLIIDLGVGGDRTIRIRTVGPHQFDAHGGIVGGLATGGIAGMQAGGIGGSARVVVGERRAEVVELPFGTRVIPSVAQATDRGQAGGIAGVIVNLYVQGSIRSDRDLIGMIRDEFLHGGFRGVLEGAAA